MNVATLERPAALVQSNSYMAFRTGISMTREIVTGVDRPFPFARALARETDFAESNHLENALGYYQMMPGGYDKVSILKHAVRIAGQPNANGAMTLGAAIGIAHPYRDGVGRITRFVHAVHAGESLQSIIDSGIISHHDELMVNGAARDIIDLTPPDVLEPIIEKGIYAKTNIVDQKFYPSFPTDDWENVPRRYDFYAAHSKRAYESSDVERGLKFALNILHASGAEIPHEEVPDFLGGQETLKRVDMNKVAAQLGVKGMKTILKSDRAYRKHRGNVWVNFVSPNTAEGAQQVTLDDMTMSMADHSVRLTKNLVKAKG